MSRNYHLKPLRKMKNLLNTFIDFKNFHALKSQQYFTRDLSCITAPKFAVILCFDTNVYQSACCYQYIILYITINL